MNQLQIFSNEELYRVHLATLEVLESIGITVKHKGILSLLQDAGAIVSRDTRHVRIPQYLVDEAVRKAPRRVTLHGRDPRHDLKLEGTKVHFRNTAAIPYILDMDTHQRRVAKKKDLADAIRLADGLNNIHMCMNPLIPSDVPAQIQPQYSCGELLKNTVKPVCIVAHGGQSARDAIKIAALVAGGSEELFRRPILVGAVEFVSPLQLDEIQAEILFEFARNRLPVIAASQPMSGSTSPVTLAGTLVQANAESLSMLLITQMIAKGSPVILETLTSTIDMRTGTFASGSIERAMLASAFVQLAQYYGLPSNIGGGVSDSKVLDEQVALEKVFTMLLPALAGANVISGAGTIESYMTFSPAQFVIDNEIAGIILRNLNGIKLGDENLAVDVIREVGIGGQFLAQRHTTKHFEREHYVPQLLNRMTRQTWEKSGSKTLVQVATEKARRILEEHQPAPLDKSIENEISNILKETEKRSPK